MAVEPSIEDVTLNPSWRPPVAPRPAGSHSGLTVLVPLVIAALFWLAGRRVPAVVIVGFAAAITIASKLSPAFAIGFQRLVRAVARYVGLFLTDVLLALLWLLVFVPIGLAIKLLRVDPLEQPEVGTSSRWQAHVRSDAKLYRHQFALERDRPIGSLTRWGRLRHGFTVAVVTVFLVALGDLGAGMIWDRIDPQGANSRPRWEKTAAHMNDPWAAEFYDAVRQREFSYDASRAFIPTDVSSRYLNVEGGVRRSYEPSYEPLGADTRGASVRIYFFGGSVLWGLGQRDEHTIPSEIARLAEVANLPIEVRNYGQSAYSLWQEVRLFEELLARGDVPDIAVFLDGYNDAIAHYDWPDADREPTTLEGDFRELLARGRAQRRSESPAGGVGAALELYANHSVTGRVWHALFGKPSYRPRKPAAPSADELASQIATSYKGSVDTARRLADSYGVATFFFWQPTAADKDVLAAGEQFMTGEKWTGFADVWNRLIPQVTDVAIDLTDVYDGHEEAIFTDIVHTNELGAALVAGRMWSVLEQPTRERATGGR
ncbi:MAG: SGNH/GDSL hydrolase family protein [Acidimicrobiales bacterium]|nr:SGNH/GDSL hydrolase family protein [Acidimicrobiales bacterium]